MDEAVRIFARRMDEERRRVGMTRVQLCREVSQLTGSTLDPSSLTRIVSGERGVRLEEAVRIAEVLGVKLSSLLRDADVDLEAELAAQRSRLAQQLDLVRRVSELAEEARQELEATHRRINELESRI